MADWFGSGQGDARDAARLQTAQNANAAVEKASPSARALAAGLMGFLDAPTFGILSQAAQPYSSYLRSGDMGSRVANAGGAQLSSAMVGSVIPPLGGAMALNAIRDNPDVRRTVKDAMEHHVGHLEPQITPQSPADLNALAMALLNGQNVKQSFPPPLPHMTGGY